MSTAPTSPDVSAQWRPVATVVACAVGGPLIGMVLLLLVVAFAQMFRNSVDDGLWMPMLALHPVAWLIAFFLGGIPALLGAIAYVALDRYLPLSLPRVVMAAALGAAATGAFLFTGVGAGNVRTVMILIAVAAVTAGLMAHLTRRWRFR